VDETAEDIKVTGPAVGLLLDEADVLDAHPAGMAQRPGRLAGDAASADDDGETLIETATAQEPHQRPRDAPTQQDAGDRQHSKQQERAARLVRIVQYKQGGEY